MCDRLAKSTLAHERAAQAVMRFGIAWLDPKDIDVTSNRVIDPARIEQRITEIVLCVHEVRPDPQGFCKMADRFAVPPTPPEFHPQIVVRRRVRGVDAQRLAIVHDGLVAEALICQRQSESGLGDEVVLRYSR